MIKRTGCPRRVEEPKVVMPVELELPHRRRTPANTACRRNPSTEVVLVVRVAAVAVVPRRPPPCSRPRPKYVGTIKRTGCPRRVEEPKVVMPVELELPHRR